MAGERGGGAPLGAEEKGMLHLFPDLLGFWPFVSLLTEVVCLTNQAGGNVLAHMVFFSHWVQQWGEVLGDFFFPPQYSRFSGKSSS